jgi:hypothetical protein
MLGGAWVALRRQCWNFSIERDIDEVTDIGSRRHLSATSRSSTCLPTSTKSEPGVVRPAELLSTTLVLVTGDFDAARTAGSASAAGTPAAFFFRGLDRAPRSSHATTSTLFSRRRNPIREWRRNPIRDWRVHNPKARTGRPPVARGTQQ